MYPTVNGPTEIYVIGHRFAPQSLRLELVPAKPCGRSLAAVWAVPPLHGDSAMCRLSVMTGGVEETGCGVEPRAVLAWW
jgi:hypothetical protein